MSSYNDDKMDLLCDTLDAWIEAANFLSDMVEWPKYACCDAEEIELRFEAAQALLDKLNNFTG